MFVLFTQAILELQSKKYVKTVDEDAVLQMEQKDRSLYVFSSFTTPAYLHCKTVWLGGDQCNYDFMVTQKSNFFPLCHSFNVM